MPNLPESYINQIPEWDFATLHEQFLGLEPDKKTIEKVKFGIKLKFNVNRIINNWFETFPRTNKVRILGVGMADLDEFTDEIDERKALMISFILSMYSGETTESRI